MSSENTPSPVENVDAKAIHDGPDFPERRVVTKINLELQRVTDNFVTHIDPTDAGVSV